jgi:PKD repeat protein
MKLLVTTAIVLLYSMAAPAQMRNAHVSAPNHRWSHQGLVHGRAERARREIKARNRGIDNMKRDFAKRPQEKIGFSSVKLQQPSSRTYNLTLSYFGKVKRFFSLQAAHLKSKWNNVSGKIASEMRFFSKVKPLLLPDFPDSGIDVKEYGTGPAPEIHFSSKVDLTTLTSPADNIHWDFGDNSTLDVPILPSNPKGEIVHMYTEAGHYNVQMVIKNGSTVVTTLIGEAETQEHDEPIPNFTLTVTGSAAPFSFHGESLAADPAGGTYSVVWSLDGTVVCQTTNCDGAIATSGNHVVSVDVTDSDNVTTSVSTNVNANGTTNLSGPVPVLIASTRIGYAPLTVDFDGSHSFSPSSTAITQYYWDFDEKDNALGNEPVTPKATRTFTRPGTYWIYLEADDANGDYNYVMYPIYVLDTTPQASQIVAFEYAPLEVYFDWDVNTLRSAAHDTGFYWDFGDGATFVGRYPDHTYASAGTYTVTLRTIDVQGNSFTTTKNVTVGSSVDVPSAVASLSSYSVPVFQNVTFDASGSSDPASQPLTYRWTFGDDGTQVTTTSPTITHSFSHRGVVPYELMVTNSRGISQSTAWYLQVTDGPVLNAAMTFDPKAGPGSYLTVNFDGSLTKSLDGQPLFHDWTWGGYSLSNDEKFSYSFPVGDNYFVHFVSDSLGNQAFQGDHVVVDNSGTVPPGNLAPVPVITLYPDLSSKLLAVSCSSSTDSDGSVVSCEWKLNGVRVSDGNFVSSLPMIDGQVNTVELTVVDNWGAKATTYAQVDLTPGTGAPTLTEFNYEPVAPIVGDTMTFGADRSTVAGGSIKKYDWDFGDSSTGSGIEVQHSYSSAGSYTVTLTTTDDSDVTHTATQTVVVAATAPTLDVTMTATDVDNSLHMSSGSTYIAHGFPETIRFTVESKGNSHGEIVYSDWLFYTSTFAPFMGEIVGRNVEYTFNQPGTYYASVASYFNDSNSFPNTYKTITIVVPELPSCKSLDGETMCLRLVGNHQGILPMSSDSWTIGTSSGFTFSTASSELKKNWIHLEALDGSGDIIDLSDATTVDGAQLHISKNAVVNKGIDLKRSYKMVVSTHSSLGANMIGEWPQLTFGSSTVVVTSVEDYTIYELVNTENHLQNLVYMGTERADTVTDIPAGQYAVTVILTDGSSVSYPVTIEPGRTTTLTPAPVMSSRVAKRSIPIPAWKRWRAGEQARTPLMDVNDNENLPSWTNSLCGEPSPFVAAPRRLYGEGESSIFSFASYMPDAQSQFTPVPVTKDNKLRLSCRIVSPALLYAQNKWKYKDGPQRCTGDSKPHPYWKDYLKSLKHESDPVIITYQIKDDWSGRKEFGHFSTSARSMMLMNGNTLMDLSSRVGLGVDDSGDWGQRSDYIITLPKDFGKPEISFQLQSTQDSSSDSFYDVECDVLAEDQSPKIVKIQTPTWSANYHTADYNAGISLQKRYGFFPLQYDDRTNAAISVKSEAAKADYEIQIQPNGRSDITWQGVEVEFSYAGQTLTKNYDFTGSGTTDSLTGIYTNEILVDTADLKNKFNWQPGKSFVELKFTPIGKITTDGDYRGSAKTLRMIALFDAQTVRDQQFSQICQNGFYPSTVVTPTQVSAFARNELLSVLMKASTESMPIRCGDISTPFGGPFELTSSWRHEDHGGADMVQVRPLADSAVQDSYDYATRLTDLAEYTSFGTNAASTVSNSTAKGQIYSFCHDGSAVLAPCTGSTVVGDLDQDMIMKICQWYTTAAGVVPEGCPSNDMTKIARLAQWIQANSVGWATLIDDTSAKLTINTGRWTAAAPYYERGWQADALTKGVWPDGRPIWAPSTDGVTLISDQRAVNCESSHGTCPLQNSFVDTNFYSDWFSISTGWK